jgi:D-beta-D-heptose 7-phosphate kinase/D-beta-D-heptose 1-phosphate adenosyltransferase
MSNIVVIGESCIDEYVYGTCDRVCPEAAALCFNHSNIKTTNPGMAGNTYENFKALNHAKHEIDFITCKSTIIKRRFIDQKYNSIIFREDINDKCDRINLLEYKNISEYDYIVISDYNKGFLSIDDIQNISKLRKNGCLIFIDTKKQLKYLSQYVDFIKINSVEFNQNINDVNDIIKYSTLIVTKGDKGAALYQNNTIKNFETEKIVLRDVCGAGDTFLSGLVMKYIQTTNIEESIIFANSCACKVVAKFGVVTV